MENPYQAPQTTATPQDAAKPLTVKQVLFSLDGRIPRSKWWAYTIITGIISNVLTSVITAATVSSSSIDNGPSGIGLVLALLISIISFWISICINAKRCHDTDRSGWYMLIPIYGLIITGFFAGTPGQNRYGANPLGQ